MQSDTPLFERKPVFDWNHVPVGTVQGTMRDPKTKDTRQLLLTLTPEAAEQLGTNELTLELPASMIFGMRRDSVTLDRPLTALKKTERVHVVR